MDHPRQRIWKREPGEDSGHAQSVLDAILTDEIVRLQAHAANAAPASTLDDAQRRITDLKRAAERLQAPSHNKQQD